MKYILFSRAAFFLLLVLVNEGSAEEKSESNAEEQTLSRERRGLNMLRLGRGLQMLRLGKRGLNMLRLGRSSPPLSTEELTNLLYNLIENEKLLAESEDDDSYIGEDYMYPSGRFRRAIPDSEQKTEGKDIDEFEPEYDSEQDIPKDGTDTYLVDEDDLGNYEKRGLAMLRLGKRPMNMLRLGKRPMNMLRLGKRPMNMLRLGKRPMNMLRLGKRPMNMLRLGKRPMNMLRLGKRPMNMLRLGKRPMNMLRLGKRPMNMLRLGKRPMNMLRLGKREDGEQTEKRGLSMLRLGKRSDDSTDETKQ